MGRDDCTLQDVSTKDRDDFVLCRMCLQWVVMTLYFAGCVYNGP